MDNLQRELMSKVNNNYRQNIEAFRRFVNWSIKSSAKNRIEALTASSDNSPSSHAGKVKILESHYEKLGSELDMKLFGDSWKEKVSNSGNLLETMSFQDSDFNEIHNQPITLAEVNYVVKVIKSN